MKMTAAVMYEQGLPTPFSESQPFKIEEVDLEGPDEGEVLVEVRAAGLCHSDLSTVAGQRKRTLPVVGGHEGAGIVREVGSGVQNLKVGDHVVMSVATGCGACAICLGGKPALCDNMSAARAKGMLPNGQRRLSRNGQPIYHYSGVSSFAQYAVATPSSLIRIDPSIPLDVAAVYGCAVVTGAGAVFNSAQLRPGKTIAVFGLGGVGLNAVMAARISGASNIIGVDIVEGKFELARELGCTHTFKGDDPDLVDKIRELTHGGVDAAFEISGAKSAVASAYAVTRKGGDVFCVGVGAAGQMYEYPHTLMVAEEKSIRGSFMGGGVGERDVPQYIRYFNEGRMPVDKLMSGTMGFGDLNTALDRLASGNVVRQILLPHG